MQNLSNILTKVAAAVLAVVLATGCIFEKECPVDCTKDVMVLLKLSVDDLQTKADETEAESMLKTVRIYAYDQVGRQIGYADDATATDGSFHMVLTVPEGQETLIADFYAVANEGAMTNLSYTAGGATGNAFKTAMTLEELHAALFAVSSANDSEFLEENGIPMCGYIIDKTLNLNVGTQHLDTVGDHAPGFTLNDEIALVLNRTLAKVAVYAAELGSATGTTTAPKITIDGISVSNVISNALVIGGTTPTATVDGGYAMLSSSASVTNTIVDEAAASVYQDDANYTPVAMAYFAENAAGSNNWLTADAAGAGMVLNITYTAGGTQKTQPIYMPAIQRNHFYKVLCRITAGGEMLLDLEVLEWDDATKQTVDFQDNVSLTGFGWNGGTHDPDNAKVTFGAAADQTASFHFTLETPKGGTWYATIAEGDLQNFAFVVDGTETRTVSGNITGEEATITIKTLQQLSIGEAKSVKIRLVAATADNSRTLTVKFGTHDYYTIEQKYN